MARHVLGPQQGVEIVDSGYYAACAGLRAKSQALEVVANNAANLNSTGYASAQVDKKKIGQLAVAIQTAFQQMGVFPGNGPGIPIPSTSDRALTQPDNQQALVNRIVYQEKLLPSQEEEDISELIPELQKSLGPELLRNELALRTEIDGLVISLREIGFCESGSSQIRATSLPAFGRIASLLLKHRCRIRIEGHTDNVPIHNRYFSDNWELSTARATDLVRLLITQYGFAPERLSAAGYAQYHPVSPNDSEETRAQNRRVDIVVLGVIRPQIIAGPSIGHPAETAPPQAQPALDHRPVP
jgi:chemotaxis protein MotB